MTQLKDMDTSQKARVFQYLGDVKADRTGYIQRANIVRDLLVTNRGRVTFVNESEFAAQTVLSNSPETDAALITKEAGAMFPGDAERAAAYRHIAMMTESEYKKEEWLRKAVDEAPDRREAYIQLAEIY